MITKRILPLFAIAMGLVLAVATSGFKEEPIEKGTQTTSWHEFVGDPSDINSVLNPNEYIYTDGLKPCNGARDICGVDAAGPKMTNSHPSAFSQPLPDKLTAVFNNTDSYAEVAQHQ